MSSIGDRIKDARRSRNISQSELARRVGVSRASASQWENDETIPTGPNMVAIARELKVKAEWLAEGRGLREAADAAFVPNFDTTHLQVSPVTVVGEVQAGVWKDALEYPPEEQFDIYVPIDPRYASFRRKVLRVKGPSMNRIYPEDSFVIIVSVIDLGEAFVPRDGIRVVVQRSNPEGQFEATIKELQYDEKGKAWLWPRSSHPDFQQPWQIPDSWEGNGDFDEHADSLRITALVIGSYRPEF